MKNIAAIVLAAGVSSRLGEPKQLLSFQHKSLLAITIEAAKSAVKGSVFVILGGNYDLIKDQVKSSGVVLLYNPEWEEGISSAIRMGINAVLKEEEATDGVILTVCDQPYIHHQVLRSLVEKAEASGKSIIASTYAQTWGVPILFSSKYFSELAGLKGQEGAKKLIVQYPDDVAGVAFEQGGIDIDTAEDYSKLLQKSQK